MDYKIIDGDYSLKPTGHLETVTGAEEIQQQMLLILTVPKGRFIFDEELGSELGKLYREKPTQLQEKARQYITEALQYIEGLTIGEIQVKKQGTKLKLDVSYSYNGQNNNVGVII